MLGFRGRFDMPSIQRAVERASDFFGELSLACARFAFDEERSCERDGRVDCGHQIVRGDVAVSARKTRGHESPTLRARSPSLALSAELKGMCGFSRKERYGIAARPGLMSRTVER